MISRSYRFVLFFCTSVFLTHFINAQVVFHHVGNEEVYAFIDELANLGIVEVNSTTKPWSRVYIAKKLIRAKEREAQLNHRQLKELKFYLRDFNKELKPGKDFDKRPDLYYYKDSLFTFSINPIGAIQFWGNKNGHIYHRRSGLEAFAYIGKHWGFYASLRDTKESEILASEEYLTQRQGGLYKGLEYNDMRGGVSYTWKWGNLSMVKDHLEWGNHYHGANIISNKAPSFAMLKLNIKPVNWFEFNYIHGWLISEVVDSTRSYTYAGADRDVYHQKYLSSNLFTFKPWKRLHFSFGNSVVYSDQGVNPAFLIPVFFYKSVDLNYNGVTNKAGQNSAMFFDISSRIIRKTHIYFSWFLDVLSVPDILDEENHANHWSFKLGGRISDLIPNIIMTAEYTRTNPMAYKNDLITTRYESNEFNMGHFLRDNADEKYLNICYKFHPKISLDLTYYHQRKGPDMPYIRGGRDPITGRSIILGRTFMESVEWENITYRVKAKYQVINDGFIFAEFIHSNISGEVETYTPPFFHGKNSTWSVGIRFGL